MIGEDDFGTFFDPDDFGDLAQLIEPGRVPRDVAGMRGTPTKSGGIYRGGIDPGASNVRASPLQEHFQIPTRDLPVDWKLTKVIFRGAQWSIANVEPLGRLRTVLTLVPFGDRSAPPGERGRWQASH